MTELKGFEQAYFIQTRQEIDTEERARDRLLYLAVIVLGAIAVATCLSRTAQEFLLRPGALALAIPALAIISTLFWVRRKKLEQISDRWFVLHRMAVRHFGPDRAKETLEGIAVRDLPTWRYISEDFTLNIAFSLPVYGLLILQSIHGGAAGQWWRTFISIIAIAAHALYSYPILGRMLRDPLPGLADPTSATDNTPQRN